MTAALKEPAPADDADDLEHGDEWEAEVQRRADEVRSGQVKGIPWEEAVAEIRAKYGWG